MPASGTGVEPEQRAPKRILYFTTIDISVPNGPGVNEREFVLSLRQRYGRDFTAVLPYPEKPIAEASGENTHFFTGQKRTKHAWERRGPLSYVTTEWGSYRALKELCAKQSFDLIVVRLRVLPLGFLIFALTSKVPFALHHLDSSINDWETGARNVGAALEYVVSFFDRAVMKALVRRAVATDTCTPELLEGVTSRLGAPTDRITIRDNVVNTDRFYPRETTAARKELGLERFRKIVGFVGGIPYEGGGRVMVALARRILAAHPGTGFAVIGGGALHDKLLQEIAENDLGEHFVVPGLRPYEEMPLYVNAFDVGLALHREAFSKTHGNSNQKVRQYVACGVPVVASAAKGNSFLDELAIGSRVDSEDLEALYAAIDRWLSLSDEERAALRARASAYASAHLSPQGSLSELSTFWARCMAVAPMIGRVAPQAP